MSLLSAPRKVTEGTKRVAHWLVSHMCCWWPRYTVFGAVPPWRQCWPKPDSILHSDSPYNTRTQLEISLLPPAHYSNPPIIPMPCCVGEQPPELRDLELATSFLPDFTPLFKS